MGSNDLIDEFLVRDYTNLRYFYDTYEPVALMLARRFGKNNGGDFIDTALQSLYSLPFDLKPTWCKDRNIRQLVVRHIFFAMQNARRLSLIRKRHEQSYCLVNRKRYKKPNPRLAEELIEIMELDQFEAKIITRFFHGESLAEIRREPAMASAWKCIVRRIRANSTLAEELIEKLQREQYA